MTNAGGEKRPRPKRPPRCPICKEPLPDPAEFFPFCSKRCKVIDLGRWLSGDYTISRPIEQSDLDEGE